MQMSMEDVETEIVEAVVVEVEMVPEVGLIELAIVQFEFALLSGIVPQWGSSAHSPSPSK